MNWFLTLSNEDPDSYILKFAKDNPAVDSQLDLGKFIPDGSVSSVLSYEVTSYTQYSIEEILSFDAIQSLTGGIVVSGRLAEILSSSFQGEAQLLPAQILHSGETYKGYYALNIYQKCACYDLEKSVYDKSPVDDSYDFERITLQKQPLENEGVQLNLVRSSHDNKIVVSDQVREKLEASPINSIVFEDKFEMEW